MGVTLPLQPLLPSSTSLRCRMPPGGTIAGCSALDFRRGQHRQTSPHGVATSGSAATMVVPRGGAVLRNLLSVRIYGKFRIIHRRKLWLATMMLGAASMGRAALPNIGSVERTITTLACRCPFARPSSRWSDRHIASMVIWFSRPSVRLKPKPGAGTCKDNSYRVGH